MKNIRVFRLNIFRVSEVKFSIYLNRRVFVTCSKAVPLLQFVFVRTSVVSYPASILRKSTSGRHREGCAS